MLACWQARDQRLESTQTRVCIDAIQCPRTMRFCTGKDVANITECSIEISSIPDCYRHRKTVR